MEGNMSGEQNPNVEKVRKVKVIQKGGPLGAFYFMTIIGAAIYFISHATSFWAGVVGFLEAFVWPVVVTIKVLELLKL
jgi:hypothetical protein